MPEVSRPPADLRARRAALGLSQSRLGALLGVPENTISRWELGTMPIERAVMLDLALTTLEESTMTTTPDTWDRFDDAIQAYRDGAPPDAPERKTIVFARPFRGPHRHARSGKRTVDLAKLSPNARHLAATITTTSDGFLWVWNARTYRERGFRPRPEAVERMYAGLLPSLDDHERRTWTFPGWCFEHYYPLITPEQYLEREAQRMVAEGWQIVGESDSRMDALHGVPARPWPTDAVDA